MRIPRGLLGATRDLYVSPQHRLLLSDAAGGEVLLPAKALLGRDGVRRVPRRLVHYHHLLFDRHQVVFADGAPAESLYPGPMALAAMGWAKLDAIRRALPGAAYEDWRPARPLLRPGQVGRSVRLG